MVRYISKPSEIEAVQWTGDNAEEVLAFTNGRPRLVEFRKVEGDEGWSLRLRAGKDGAQKHVPVPVGHWIVHPPGDLSDVWPVDPDYFAKKYEAVEQTIVLSCLPCGISYTFTGDAGSRAEENNEFFLGHGGCR